MHVYYLHIRTTQHKLDKVAFIFLIIVKHILWLFVFFISVLEIEYDVLLFIFIFYLFPNSTRFEDRNQTPR